MFRGQEKRWQQDVLHGLTLPARLPLDADHMMALVRDHFLPGVTREMYAGNLAEKVGRRDFGADLTALTVRLPEDYAIDAAHDLVLEAVVAQLRERAVRSRGLRTSG